MQFWNKTLIRNIFVKKIIECVPLVLFKIQCSSYLQLWRSSSSAEWSCIVEDIMRNISVKSF